MTANNPLTPELCRLFVTLERNGGSLGDTAKELKDSTANLSKRVRPLLHGSPPHLPRPWLEKRGKRFFLTPEGKTMLPAATELAARWAHFTAFAALASQIGLTVACGQEAAGAVVLDAAREFRRKHPEARFRVAVARGEKRIAGVANGLYDIALVTHSKVAIAEIARRPVSVTELAPDDLVVACAAKSEWADEFADGDVEVNAAEAAGWPLVLPESDSPIRRQWDEMTRRAGDTPPKVAVEVGGWRVLLGYVLAGFGVGLMPKSVAVDAGKKLLWRPLSHAIRPGNRLRVVTLNPPTNAELVDAFLAELV